MKKNELLMIRLATLRADKKMSQKQLAVQLTEIMGHARTLSVGAISHWENGEKIPTYETLCALAELYGVTVPYLTGESDSRTAIETNAGDNNSEKQETIKIPFTQLSRYDGRPVYVVFNNKQYQNRWGLCDFKANKIHFINSSMIIDSKASCSYYALKPYFDDTYDVSSSKPYDLTHMLSAQNVYVRMLTQDIGIQKQYEGWYRHNEVKSCLINEIGLTLPYSGLGISYNAYSAGKRN